MFDELRSSERHLAFHDGFVVADLEPTRLDLGEIASDVSGIDGDVESGEWLLLGAGDEISRTGPVSLG